MVRVISAHHFKSQDVGSCPEPCSTATAGDHLLLASPLHQIEVRDLVRIDTTPHTLPTVDRVVSMVHSNVGRYLATLESRDEETNFVRIYLNWWSPEAVSQPMRARIAGRVTPASTNQESLFLEMIELTVKEKVTSIDVCPATGNLITASGQTLTIFKYTLASNSQTKSKFVDFQECFTVHLSYNPLSVKIVEDTIACLDQYQVHAFKIKVIDGGDEKQLRSLSTYSFSSESESSMDPWPAEKSNNGGGCGVTHPSIANITARRRTDSSCERDQSGVGGGLRRAPGHLTLGGRDDSDTDTDMDIIPVPLVERAEREVGCIATPRILEQSLGPCVTPPHLSVTVDIVPGSAWSQASDTALVASPVTLLYAKIIEDERQHDQLKLLRMTPVYWREFRIKRDKADNSQSSSSPHNPLQSLMFSHLMSLSLMFTSVHEGYLYHIPGHIRRPGKGLGVCKIATYPFTCPVLDLVLEPSVLHALTETGLETYTLRSGYHTIREAETVDDKHNACPPTSTPLCLIGLRPFIGVRHLVLGLTRLVLLTEPEQGSDTDLWTVYSLHLPSHQDLYTDMLAVADINAGAPHGHHQLLCEAHIIARTWLHRLTWCQVMKVPGVSVTHDNITAVTQSFHQSCARLAQHYIKSNKSKEYKLAIPYYRMSKLALSDILQDVKGEEVLPGVLKLVEEMVTDPSTTETFLDAGAADTIIKFLGEKSIDTLVKLVIASPSLRSFKSKLSLEYIEADLRRMSSEDFSVKADHSVAAVLVGGIGDWFSMAPPIDLSETLLRHHQLLFDDNQTFSDFALIFRDSVTLIFVEICVSLTQSGQITLGQMLHMYLQTFMTAVTAGSPSAAAADNAAIFQLFLETYFTELLTNDSVSCSLLNDQEQALLTLVRSYLSSMMLPIPGPLSTVDDSMVSSGPEEMFGPRHEYLDSLPPFNSADDDGRQETTLLKLQSLLCSQLSSDNCKATVLAFLEQNCQFDLSLRVLCQAPTKDLISKMSVDSPGALSGYCKHIGAKTPQVWVMALEALLTMKGNSKELYNARESLLDEMTRTFPPDKLEELLPQREEFQHYLTESRRFHQAAKLQAMIVATGHTLLDSLAL